MFPPFGRRVVYTDLGKAIPVVSVEQCAEQMARAVLAEREACAAVAHDIWEAVSEDGASLTAALIEDRIRARGGV
jgi:hypothetical protein